MKKLMILMLVLGLASAANAALVLSLNGSTDVTEITVETTTYFTIDVYSPVALPDEFFLKVIGPASYGDLGTVHIPPAPATMVVNEYQPKWLHGYMAPPVGVANIGVWFEIELHCDDLGDVLINLYDYSGWYIIDTAVIHQIPEPITIALLGLGGLLLRRRK